ncbi:MAG: hypothetical protein ACOCQA_01500, partial [bacterium]
MIQDFRDENINDPMAIVGAYRSGKTQFMYEMFKYSWEMGIPALYIGDPSILTKSFEDSKYLSLIDWIKKWFEPKIKDELEAIIKKEIQDINFFPNVNNIEYMKNWLEKNVEIEKMENISKIVIFIDEVEQHYKSFLTTFDTDDDNPLRIINDDFPQNLTLFTDVLKVW